MDRSIYEYLRTRNTFTNLAIFFNFLFALALVLINYAILSYLNYPLLLITTSIMVFPLVIVVSLIISRKINRTYDNKYKSEITGGEYVKVKGVIIKLVKELRINKRIRLYQHSRGLYAGVKVFPLEAHILMGNKFLGLKLPMITAVMCHELVHVHNNDPLKVHDLDTLAFLIAIYALLTFVLIAPINMAIAMIILGVIGISGTYLTLLPRRMMEETADCTTAYLGYGSGLIQFFGHFSKVHDAIGLFSTHDTVNKRISYTIQAMEEVI